MEIEKQFIDKIQQNKIDIENLKFRLTRAERDGDYGKVAEIRYGKIKQKQEEIAKYQSNYRFCKQITYNQGRS